MWALALPSSALALRLLCSPSRLVCTETRRAPGSCRVSNHKLSPSLLLPSASFLAPSSRPASAVRTPGCRPFVAAMAQPPHQLENFHDTSGLRFGVSVNGDEAYVAYEKDEAARTLDLTHTFTPESLRGQGLASKVVTLAFEYAKENDYRIIPTCTYIPVFVKKNPQWSSLVVE